jgi:hypothetical protein
MSHWAQVNENNEVICVLVGPNEGDEGKTFFESLGGTWIKTSYNSKIRFNYASIGFTYDPIDDAFIAPMPLCGHKELTLSNLKRWECTNEEHNGNKL